VTRTLIEIVVPRVLGSLLVAVTASGSLIACATAEDVQRESSADGDQSPQLTVPLARAPYMGVSCDGRPNWIGCDRVGLYVYLTHDVARLTASIEGRGVPMRRARGGEDARHNWEGFLKPAGLIDGPLKVRPDRGRYHWFGRRPVYGRVRLTAFDDEDRSATTRLRLRLAAGYG
jgi:hypothetical protein